MVFVRHISTDWFAADVSHHGLFIALWTIIEASLGFLAACSLCFPKLVRVKGQRFIKALSNFSVLRNGSGSHPRENQPYSNHTGDHQLEGIRNDHTTYAEDSRQPCRNGRIEPQSPNAVSRQHSGQIHHDIYSTTGSSGHPAFRDLRNPYRRSLESAHSSEEDDDVTDLITTRPRPVRSLRVRTQEPREGFELGEITMLEFLSERRKTEDLDVERRQEYAD